MRKRGWPRQTCDDSHPASARHAPCRARRRASAAPWQAKAATARPVGTEDLQASDPDVRLRLPAPKAAPRPFARARATNVEQPSCPRTRNLAPSSRASAENGHGTAFWHGSRPCRPPFAAKPRRNPRSRKSTGRSRPDFGTGSVPERGSVAIFAPFSRTACAARSTTYGARRATRAVRRSARDARLHSAPPRRDRIRPAPDPAIRGIASIRTPHAAYRTTYDMRRAPHSARPHSTPPRRDRIHLTRSAYRAAPGACGCRASCRCASHGYARCSR